MRSAGTRMGRAELTALLRRVLVGVDPSRHDERILDWLADCARPVAQEIVELIGRARQAGALTACPHTGVYAEAYAGDPVAQDPTRGVPWRVIAPEQQDLNGVRAYAILGTCGSCSARVVSVRTWDDASPSPVWSSSWVALVKKVPPCPRCGRRLSPHPNDQAEGYCGHCHDWTVPPSAPDQTGRRPPAEVTAGRDSGPGGSVRLG